MYDLMLMKEICDKAHLAGQMAVQAARVIPMVVGQSKSLFGSDIDYTQPTYFVEDGPCGFAWVDLYPMYKGNTRLGKDERAVYEKCGFRKSHESKKFYLWVKDYNQSIQKKEAYAQAYAAILRENGLKAYSGSRLD